MLVTGGSTGTRTARSRAEYEKKNAVRRFSGEIPSRAPQLRGEESSAIAAPFGPRSREFAGQLDIVQVIDPAGPFEAFTGFASHTDRSSGSAGLRVRKDIHSYTNLCIAEQISN
ncbi:MAG: hypothetical protein A2428_08585 [Bdellovibrionales bacterium RIFOXYC1_FULL_54_43]|nr:MAG: hypothetical protein A2428_08585 [Bdellovibrionales bacterium RIFOXYC1_FULL_54_43]OFZ84274.1 MAG: hypothetical protein A2603_15165 [Bdellovibrionales bacterium RIFOXYD1_FULL_55_31]